MNEITDTDRLNWLQENNKTAWRCYHTEVKYTSTDYYAKREAVNIFDGWTVDDPDNPKPTIREAIDHAIEASKQAS